MMKNKTVIIVLLLLLFLFTIYLNAPSSNEGMCTMPEDENTGDIVVYYGSIGSVKVKVVSNGDKYVVKLNPHNNVDSSQLNSMEFYGPDGDTIKVYKTENGEYVISDEVHLEENDVITYYGKNGSVTVKTDSNGEKSIVDYNTSYSNDSTSVNTFYGPNGLEVNVIRTPDGNLKLVTGYGSTKTSTNKNDYILKTEVVPPVCPTCPAVNYCDNKCSDIDNANEIEDDETEEESESTTNTVTGPQGGSITQTTDESGNTSTTISNGSTSSSSSSSSSGSSSTYSMMIGSLLNEYAQTDPMPVLSDFSKF